MSASDAMLAIGQAARQAARKLALATTAQKNAALHAMASRDSQVREFDCRRKYSGR